VTQSVRWPLVDEHDDVLMMEVPWSRLNAYAIERIEALADGLEPNTLVVARVQRVRRTLVGEPLSLILPGRSSGVLDSLHFDDGPRKASPSSLVASLLAADAPDRVAPEMEAATPRSVPIPLAELRSLIEQEAQRGCAGVAAGTVHRRLCQAHSALRRSGLSLFVDPDPALDPAQALLRSLYLVQQIERALD
jgi:hypothetical protein